MQSPTLRETLTSHCLIKALYTTYLTIYSYPKAFIRDWQIKLAPNVDSLLLAAQNRNYKECICYKYLFEAMGSKLPTAATAITNY